MSEGRTQSEGSQGCVLPGGQWPTVIIMGASGSGKTSVGEEIARRASWALVENCEVAEHLLGMPLSEAMIRDPQGAQEALTVAARQCLTPGGKGAGAAVVLSASAPLDPEVHSLVEQCRVVHVPVVALSAPLEVLARRNGLLAARPSALGTPRAWFRQQLGQVEDAYSLVADYWCDTGSCDSSECAMRIATEFGLPFAVKP